MSFRFDAPRDTFDSLVSIGRRIEGEYHEQVDITGIGVEKKSYYSKGTFTLNRLHESNAIVPWDGVDDSEEGEVPEQSEEEIVENDSEPTSEDDNVEDLDFISMDFCKINSESILRKMSYPYFTNKIITIKGDERNYVEKMREDWSFCLDSPIKPKILQDLKVEIDDV